jgi:hypothetical protein
MVWDCIFYTEDEEGNVTLYNAPKLDFSHVAEYPDYSDLVELGKDNPEKTYNRGEVLLLIERTLVEFSDGKSVADVPEFINEILPI